MKTYLWKCRDCGQEIVSATTPHPLLWTDGHSCQRFERVVEFRTRIDLKEALRATESKEKRS